MKSMTVRDIIKTCIGRFFVSGINFEDLILVNDVDAVISGGGEGSKLLTSEKMAYEDVVIPTVFTLICSSFFYIDLYFLSACVGPPG